MALSFFRALMTSMTMIFIIISKTFTKFLARVSCRNGWFLRGPVLSPSLLSPRATCFELRGAVAVMLARWLGEFVL